MLDGSKREKEMSQAMGAGGYVEVKTYGMQWYDWVIFFTLTAACFAVGT